MKNERKVLVIGLDGGTWSIFDKFIEFGVMPNLQRLCAASYRAKLMSTIPPITPTAWASFATGMNPGKHGIYGFTVPRAGSENYAAPLARRNLIDQPTLWRRLSDAGLESIVLCVPLTYPAEPIKGSLVTGMFTPGLHSKCTYPPSLKQELLTNNCMPRFKMDVAPGKSGREANLLRRALRNDAADFLEDLSDITERLHKAACYLIKKPWRFFMPMFIGTDRIQHVLYDKIMSICLNDTSHLSQGIRKFYSQIDSIIGEIIEAAGDKTVCMLMSDHGFGRCAGMYYLGQWLIEMGYTRYQPARLHHFGKIILEMAHVKQLVRGYLSDKHILHTMSSSYPLDWSQSRVFFVHGDGIRINVKGREAQGIVNPGAEYESLRQELRKQLLEIKDPTSGRPVISRVWFAEEIYHGKCLQWAPDIVFEPSSDPCYTFAIGQLSSPCLKRKIVDYTGNHRTEGIFLAYGPDVKPNANGPGVQIVDLCPTILYQLGLPVPDDIDGRIIKEAFVGAAPGRAVEATATGTTSAVPPSSVSISGPYTHEEERALRQRLKDLGYLD